MLVKVIYYNEEKKTTQGIVQVPSKLSVPNLQPGTCTRMASKRIEELKILITRQAFEWSSGYCGTKWHQKLK